VRETELALVETPGASLRTLPVLQASSGEKQERERVACQKPRLDTPGLAARPSGVENIEVFSVRTANSESKTSNRKNLITNGLCLNASFVGQAENRDVISTVESC